MAGVALDTITLLELKEATYDEALILLKNRFDNKLLHFQMHINKLFALSSAENGPTADLCRFSDRFNSHLHAMQTIGNQQQITDGLLFHLVTKNMDAKSRIKW